MVERLIRKIKWLFAPKVKIKWANGRIVTGRVIKVKVKSLFYSVKVMSVYPRRPTY